MIHSVSAECKKAGERARKNQANDRASIHIKARDRASIHVMATDRAGIHIKARDRADHKARDKAIQREQVALDSR